MQRPEVRSLCRPLSGDRIERPQWVGSQDGCLRDAQRMWKYFLVKRQSIVESEKDHSPAKPPHQRCERVTSPSAQPGADRAHYSGAKG